MSAYSDSEENFDYGMMPQEAEGVRRSERARAQPEKGRLIEYPSGSEAGSDVEVEERTDFWKGFVDPPIEQILGFDGSRYQVKLKDRSYMHLKWLSEEDILKEGRQGKTKLNRFHRDKLPFQTEQDNWFDLALLEVDRIMYTTEIFPVVHPRQATLVSDRWQGKCAQMLSKIVNFVRNDIPYGAPYFKLLDIEIIPNYFKVVQYPIDYVTIHNRLYNGYYVQPIEFWKDLGFIYKNTQFYYTDSSTDSRILADTLRELTIEIYKQWQASTEEAGPYTLYWVIPVPEVDCLSVDFLQYELPPFDPSHEEEDLKKQVHYLTEEERASISIEGEVDKLFLVKWKTLSYADSTWETESSLNCPAKVSDFYRFNRAIDPRTRQYMVELNSNFGKTMQLLKSDYSRSRQFMPNSHLMHYQMLIDFPGFDFRREIQFNTLIPSFKEGKALKDYQISGLHWLLHNWASRRNSILADEMGLGKTVQVLSFIQILVTVFKFRGPYLVIAPLSTLSHWRKTVEDWTHLNCVIYHDPSGAEGRACCREYETYYTDITKKGGVSTKSKLVKFHILVTSYEVYMQDHNKFFSELPFQMAILDEAHRLKNKQAKILTYLRELPIRRFVLMTGTPLQNNTEELWSLLNFIEPQVFYSLPHFLSLYGNLETSDQVQQLQANISPYLLRRLKEEVETSIPPLQETIIDVELTNIQKSYYRAIYEKNRTFLNKGGQVPQLANMEMQIRKCCNHPFLIKGVGENFLQDDMSNAERMRKMVESSGKMVLLDKLLPKLRSQSKKVLIFSQFTQMLNLLEEYLHFYEYKFERLDGSVKASDRQASIERFNTDDQNVDIFLLSTRAGGFGINLTSAQVVIIFDSDWNPQNDVQATARAHRIGQTEEVQVYRLITARTYETQMFEKASKKLGLDQAVFLSKENKSEVEKYLKYGAYTLLEDDGKSQNFVESNIDEILSTNSRVINYGLLRGTYKFNKSSFVAHGADTSISIDDPNFWNKILPVNTSQASRLLNRINDKDFSPRSQEGEFMEELEQTVNDCDPDNNEDKELLVSLLFQVAQDKKFSKQARKTANQLMKDMNRPTRNRKAVKTISSPKYLSESEDEDEPQTKKKVTSFCGTGILCAHCEKEGCGWFCAGPCMRAFHTECKDKPLDINHDASTPENEEMQAYDNLGWICKDCTKNKARCFICNAKGVYLAHKDSADESEGLVRCSQVTCGKAYHLSCLNSVKKRTMCPLHYCSVCKGSGNNKTMIQCVRCPSAFHIRCYQRKVARLNRRNIICHAHKQPFKIPVYPNQKNKLVLIAKKIKDWLNENATKYAYLAMNKKKKTKCHLSKEEIQALYEANDMVIPEEFDYASFEEDWCRFCGARKGVFFVGPWGEPGMLCSTHATAWKQKRSIYLPEELPDAPVNLEKNTEIKQLLNNSN